MADKKKVNEKEQTYDGCYGEQVGYEGLDMFLDDVFAMNLEADKSKLNERFATCVWGHAGCVLADTEIEVRKIGNGNHHKIIVVNPNPV